METDSLFGPEEKLEAGAQPLAVRMRPRTLDDFVGQEKAIGRDTALRRAILADRLSSLVVFGPPGTGKTSLAFIIAAHTRGAFEKINAVTSNVHDIRRIIAGARARKKSLGRKTILFVDEIHRFNRAQQDAFMEDVEEGNIILVGATTHNPFFSLSAPLLSRSRVVEFEPLTDRNIRELISRALDDTENGLGKYRVRLAPPALKHLITQSGQDARRALSNLELAVLTTPPGRDGVISISRAVAETVTGRRIVRYDRREDEHYDHVSAFIKSIRGSDPDAAVYYLARMLEAGEDPRFIARRMVILASEDVGNACPEALPLAVAAAQALEFIGMPEGKITLAQATTFLAAAPKSNAAYMAVRQATADLSEKEVLPVPAHLREAAGGNGAARRAAGYRNPHDYPDHFVVQDYLSRERRYYHPSRQGAEAEIARRLEALRETRNLFRRKARIRARLSAARAAMTPENKAALSERISKCLLRDADFQKARVIALYASCRNEVDTGLLMEKTPALGKELCLPRVDRSGREIRFFHVSGSGDLARGAFGILEPGAACPPVAPEKIELIVVPGIAFDENGNRIGFGGGYYDRFLPSLRPGTHRIALAYEFQVLREKLPVLPKDVKIGKIITEERVITVQGFAA